MQVRGFWLDASKLNEPMLLGLIELLRQSRKGRWTNAIVRKDGVENLHQADWIKHLKPVHIFESCDGWQTDDAVFSPPKFHKKIDGIFMVRGNGSCRYLTAFESIAFRVFGLMPKDCITEKTFKTLA
jgi:hypothetical protein